jgi:hypothetical protein
MATVYRSSWATSQLTLTGERTHPDGLKVKSRVPGGLSPTRKLLVDEHQDARRLLRSAISNGKRR